MSEFQVGDWVRVAPTHSRDGFEGVLTSIHEECGRVSYEIAAGVKEIHICDIAEVCELVGRFGFEIGQKVRESRGNIGVVKGFTDTRVSIEFAHVGHMLTYSPKILVPVESAEPTEGPTVVEGWVFQYEIDEMHTKACLPVFTTEPGPYLTLPVRRVRVEVLPEPTPIEFRVRLTDTRGAKVDSSSIAADLDQYMRRQYPSWASVDIEAVDTDE